MRFALALVVAALCIPAALAQNAPTTQGVPHDAREDARLQLTGVFIGANEMMAVLQMYCGGDYGDAPDDADGALNKLRPFVRADEFAVLSDYIVSPDFAAERGAIDDKMRRAFANVSAATPDKATACRTFAQDILRNYNAAKSDLETLR